MKKKKETRLTRESVTSDPVSFSCTCSASADGLVLLFYRYFATPPALPEFHTHTHTPSSLAAFHINLTQKYSLGGKVRVAEEGFNITVGGTREHIESYIQDCRVHWSFAGLDLSSNTAVEQFFKATKGGCACVFGGASAKVQICAEITPMGVTNYLPARWDGIDVLSPEEFHQRCERDDVILIDVRNYYESRIGYFVDGAGEKAITPAIRRFSQWPLYVRRNMMNADRAQQREKALNARQIITYCTGGIRCEKGARFLQENMPSEYGDRVCTLKGGITAYLTWMDDEMKRGTKRAENSLFKGRNYVFDARGSTGLSVTEAVSHCHNCGKKEDRLSKCHSYGCHLILVVCEMCEEAKPRCCSGCRDLEQVIPSQRPICECEKMREQELWDRRG